MKQSSLGFRQPTERANCNVLHVAFDQFNPKCRPANYEAALTDPVFRPILNARAAQLLKKMNKRSCFGNPLEAKSGR